LTENRDVLDRLALELLERETLNQQEIAEVFKDIRKRDVREVWLSKESRPVSTLPPVVSAKERREAAAAHQPNPDSVLPQDQLAHANLQGPQDAPSQGGPSQGDPSSNGLRPGGDAGPHGTDGGSGTQTPYDGGNVPPAGYDG
nr:cell division protein FtsH [Acidobacteriota bacterium]